MKKGNADPLDAGSRNLAACKLCPTDRDELVTAPVVAKFLNTTVNNLTRWRWEKKGPAYVTLGGRSIRYRWRDVEAYIEQNRTGPRA